MELLHSSTLVVDFYRCSPSGHCRILMNFTGGNIPIKGWRVPTSSNLQHLPTAHSRKAWPLQAANGRSKTWSSAVVIRQGRRSAAGSRQNHKTAVTHQWYPTRLKRYCWDSWEAQSSVLRVLGQLSILGQQALKHHPNLSTNGVSMVLECWIIMLHRTYINDKQTIPLGGLVMSGDV